MPLDAPVMIASLPDSSTYFLPLKIFFIILEPSSHLFQRREWLFERVWLSKKLVSSQSSFGASNKGKYSY
jgi:hypothetical protein